MTDPLAFETFEVVWGASALAGVVIAALLLRRALREQVRPLVAVAGALLAVVVPFLGPIAGFALLRADSPSPRRVTNP